MKSIESLAAGWYRWMGVLGLLLSVAVFLLYGFGVLPTQEPASDVAEYWSRPVAEHRTGNGSPYGPGWILEVADGALASTLALALLASTALPTLMALSIAFFRRGDGLYGLMSLAVVLVLVSAMLGLP